MLSEKWGRCKDDPEEEPGHWFCPGKEEVRSISATMSLEIQGPVQEHPVVCLRKNDIANENDIDAVILHHTGFIADCRQQLLQHLFISSAK